MLEIPGENKNLVDLDGALNVEESDTINKLVYTGIRKVVSNTSSSSKICCVTVFKHEFDEKLKLKVANVNILVTVTSLQMAQLDDIPADDLELDAQLICDVKRSHNNYKLFSFPWRPGNLLCWIYIFTIIDIMVLTATLSRRRMNWSVLPNPTDKSLALVILVRIPLFTVEAWSLSFQVLILAPVFQKKKK